MGVLRSRCVLTDTGVLYPGAFCCPNKGVLIGYVLLSKEA